ncbi:uncharacterized protein LOC131597605 [Vicia villosa]|uniref:uncharacterized protein LOC131597605 n=1 Tax=Vicia villosa TaxID=3911 RepID=UPI00273C1CF6|nr:uncharacterized protein LOC131597605 [Vicia villosa]
MNVALLSKWKWIILVEDDAVWSGLLRSRYGNVKKRSLLVILRWWRKTIQFGGETSFYNYVLLLNDNFSGVVSCDLGNGFDIPFWYSNWAGGQQLSQAFPELLVLSKDDKLSVAEAGFYDAEGWQWSAAAILRGSSTGTAATQLHSSDTIDFLWGDLVDSIRHTSPRENAKDIFSWNATLEGVFSVKSCYNLFKARLSGPPISPLIVKSVKHLWKVKAPPKVMFFGWRIIHNRLATKDQLIKRGILMDGVDSDCVFCSTESESLSHLLGGCLVVEAIWRKVYEWIGPVDDLTLDEFKGFLFEFEKVKNLAKRSLVTVIWLASVWSIWNRRNEFIFKNDSFSFTECLFISLHFVLCRLGEAPSS